MQASPPADKRTLLVHVGLPKTGTTTLQKYVFPRFSHYLGKVEPTSGSRKCPATELVRRRFQASPSYAQRRDDLRRWAAKYLDVDGVAFLLSAEELSWWHTSPKSGHWPLQDSRFDTARIGTPELVRFLSDLKQAIEPETKLRVALTIRAQTSFVGSYYSEKHQYFPCFGQRDLERRVRRLVRSSDEFLNWGLLVKSIEEALGQENLSVCVFEDGLEVIANQIARILGEDVEQKHIGRANVRMTAPLRWEVDVHEPPSFCRIRTRIGIRNAQPAIAKAPSTTIEITPKLRQQIRQRYDNRSLEVLLGRELRTLGY